MLLNKNIKLIVNNLLSSLVFVLLSFAIYQQLLQKSGWRESIHQIKNAVSGAGQWKIWLVFLLMIANWGLEARKWQLSVASVQQIGWWRAFRATLTGSTLASFTPNRMGECLGRMLYIDEGKRMQSISLTIICSFSQIIVTMVMGCAGVIYMLWHLHHNTKLNVEILHLWLNILLIIVLVILVVLSLFYFQLSWLVKLMRMSRVPEKYLVYVKILEDLRTMILLRILLLSFFRYCVFIVQYYFMFSVFAVSLSWAQTFSSMSVVFLVMAIVPTFTFLTELGLRWEASIQLVAIFSPNTVGIFACSFGIWLINLVVPALAGSLLILGIKLFKNR